MLNNANDGNIEFTTSKMRIITKAGDEAKKFTSGTKFRLFAVQNGTDWSAAGTKLYDVEGTGDDTGYVDYSIIENGKEKKASYDVGKNLDFYGVTYGTSDNVPVVGNVGNHPKVTISLSNNTFPDLMYSSNLKNKNSSSGLLNMEFRHALSKLKFEVLKQDETADDDKKLTDVVLKKVVLKGSASNAEFNVKTGKWTTLSTADRLVYDNPAGLKVDIASQSLKKDDNDIELIVVPNSSELYLEITVDVDGNSSTENDKVITYKLMASETDYLRLDQNHEYTLSIVILKNDVRIVTVTPKTYDWIDVDLGNVAYFGQPVYFGGLMWMDRNLGAKSADCENDWYNSLGYYYQYGRNIPYIYDREAHLKGGKTSFIQCEGAKDNAPNDSDNPPTNPDAVWNMNILYTLTDKGEKITTAKYANRTDGSCLYDNVAKNPGEAGEYSYILGIVDPTKKIGNRTRSWAITGFTESECDDSKNENQTYWLSVENQPCPKGWRLPTKNDLYSFMPEDEKLLWEQTYYPGEDMRTSLVVGNETLKPKYKYSESAANIGKWDYKWSYFAGKFTIDPNADPESEFSSPVKDATYARVYGIKFIGENKAYRVMFEQKPYTKEKAKKYVRIYRYNTNASDEFKVSADGTKWNLHQFDWSSPAEYMDIPLSGFIFDGGFTELGKGAILRASDPSTSRGNNWTLYLRSGSNGVCVTDNTRRNLGENIRCVRDVNAK